MPKMPAVSFDARQNDIDRKHSIVARKLALDALLSPIHGRGSHDGFLRV